MSRSAPTPDSTISLGEIARVVQGELVGDGSLPIRSVARPLDAVSEQDLALAMNPQGLAELERSRARAAIVVRDMEVSSGVVDAHIVVDRPRYALALLLGMFERPPCLPSGVHPSAVVEPSARIAPDATIGALSYIGEEVEIGAQVRIMPNVTVAAGSVVGEGSLLYPGVRIGENTRVGRRVIIHGNACIGSDGFSFATSEAGGLDSAREEKEITARNREPLRIPSLGRVILEDEVEVGACTTIDRATLGDTLVRQGSKIDNLVMIAHNSEIGENCLIAGQSGVSGSCRIGDRVIMGGQVGIADHMRVGDDAIVAASSGVGQHVPPRSLYIDTPAVPYAKWQERYRHIGRLKRLFRELDRLKQRLLFLEKRAAAADPGESSAE